MEINAYLIFLLIIVVVTALYSCIFGKKSIMEDNRYLLVIFAIVFAFMIIREATVGIDGGNYARIFDYCSQKSFVELFTFGRHEIGYKVLNRIVYLFGGDFGTLVALVSGFAVFSYYCFIKKYSTNYMMSISLFLGFDFFIFSFGILRESIAIGFILFAISAVIEKKTLRFYILVLAGALFHYVAIMFIPVYLLCKIRINKKVVAAWIAIIVVLFFTKGLIVNYILSNIYAPVGLEKGGLGEGGYVMMLMFFGVSICALATRRRLGGKTDRKMEIFTKIMMAGTVIQVFATYYSLLYRAAILFLTAAICLIPIITEKVSKNVDKICLRAAVPVASFGYFAYRAMNGKNGFVDYSLNEFAGAMMIVIIVVLGIIIMNGILTQKTKNSMKKEIMFLTSTLSSRGGAERVIVSLANWMVRNETEYRPVIVMLDRQDSAYEIDGRVKIIRPGNSFSKNRIIAMLQRVIFCAMVVRKERAKFIVSFYSKMVFYAKIASTRDSILVGSERANPRMRTWTQKIIDRVAFKMCDKFIFQTTGAQGYFKDKKNKSIVIANPINESAEVIDDYKKEKRIIAVGRLSEQKGFDILISAFGKIAKKDSSYYLVIFGEGEEKERLLGQIKRLRLDGRVRLMGRSDSVVKEMSRSKIFVLSSRYEGMPNALIEAMASGVACISTKCDYGPSDLIKNEVNGILVDVDDVDQLAKKIDELIRDDAKREMLAKKAYNINSKLQADKIYRKYIKYIIK